MKNLIAKLALFIAAAFPVIALSSCSDDEDVRSGYANIYTVIFEDQDVVKVQPKLDDTTTPHSFVFYVRHDTPDSELKALVPTIEITPDATISPASGVAADFSGGSVRYTVTSPNGATQTDYDIVCKRALSDEAYVVSIVFEDDIVAEQPDFEPGDKTATFKVKPGTTAEEKKSLTPEITFIGASIDPESGEAVDFSEESEVVYTVTAVDGTKFEFTLVCETALYEDALIEEMTFESDLVVLQPEIKDDQITFYVSEDATAEQIAALAPEVLVISEGATVNYPAGTAPGFKIGEPVRYEVTAEDGSTVNVYDVTCKYVVTDYYDLDKWYPGNPNATYKYDMATRWCNANIGVSNSMGVVNNKTYPLNKTEDTPSGDGYAAELKTIQLKPNWLGQIGGAPNLVAGNLFLGGFHLEDTKRPLLSTKFGVPYYNQPVVVKGMFKYTPGDDFYNNYDLITGEELHDSFAMTALLYEVDDYGDYNAEEGKYNSNDFGTTITGEDMATIATHERLVAIAQWNSTDTYSDFTPFELNLNYIKEYDSSKKYKFTMVFSSSKDGASFYGADGSTLIVDEIYVISK